MTVFILVVDDEPDVEALFRQQFRRDLRAQRFGMDFAFSATDALTRIASFGDTSLILILSDINMPGMTGLDMLPKVREMRPDVPGDHDHGLWRPRNQAKGHGERCCGLVDETDRLHGPA